MPVQTNNYRVIISGSMKKWKDYSRQEKGMLIVICVLLLAILLTYGRVQKGVEKGYQFFYSPAPTAQTK